ncbi:MAG: hypothetical protein CM15mP51_24860 [Porticoccaceae bacterium]|nr:MAG: hypothetical protein CM15mP51_24860 [Porticoccaceae bacterium]
MVFQRNQINQEITENLVVWEKRVKRKKSTLMQQLGRVYGHDDRSGFIFSEIDGRGVNVRGVDESTKLNGIRISKGGVYSSHPSTTLT